MSLLTLCDEEVENGNNGGVPTEHVVPAALHSLQSHTQALPDLKCTLNAGPHVSISLKEATDKNISNQLMNANLSSQFMFWNCEKEKSKLKKYYELSYIIFDILHSMN